MKVEQLSIFLENKAGRLAQGNQNAGGSGNQYPSPLSGRYVRFRHSPSHRERYGKAINIMKEAGFTVGRTAVVAVEVDDKPVD